MKESKQEEMEENNSEPRFEEIHKLAMDAYKEYFKYSTCMLMVRHKNKFVPNGSGTFIKHKGRYFVATCEHVINGFLPDDILVGMIKSQVVSIQKYRTYESQFGTYEDIALLEVKSEYDEELEKASVDSAEIQLIESFPKDSVYFISGFPSERFFPEKGYFQFIPYMTALFDGSIAGENFDWTKFIYLSFPEESINRDMEEYLMPGAPGYSGGGIWKLVRNQGELISRKNLKLVATETSWYAKSRVVRGLKIDFVKQLLETI